MDNENLPTNQHQFFIECSHIWANNRCVSWIMVGLQAVLWKASRARIMCMTNTNGTQSRKCTWVQAQTGHIERPGPHSGAETLQAHSPDDVSVNTAKVWPPTDCMVNGCSRGADTVLLSTPPYTVSSSFKVKDTCTEHRCCSIFKN